MQRTKMETQHWRLLVEEMRMGTWLGFSSKQEPTLRDANNEPRSQGGHLASEIQTTSNGRRKLLPFSPGVYFRRSELLLFSVTCINGH